MKVVDLNKNRPRFVQRVWHEESLHSVFQGGATIAAETIARKRFLRIKSLTSSADYYFRSIPIARALAHDVGLIQ